METYGLSLQLPGISNQEDFRDEISVLEDPTLSNTNLNESYVVREVWFISGFKHKIRCF